MSNQDPHLLHGYWTPPPTPTVKLGHREDKHPGVRTVEGHTLPYEDASLVEDDVVRCADCTAVFVVMHRINHGRDYDPTVQTPWPVTFRLLPRREAKRWLRSNR